MRAHSALVTLMLLLVGTSCMTAREKPVVGWPGAQVFKMPQAFMSETLELKDGRFRYWFSSDVIVPGGPKYPIEGSYSWRGDELTLSSGKEFKARQVNGRSFLLWPIAVDSWDQRQIISGHILLPVESIDSPAVALESYFTPEQMDRSAKKVMELEQSR